MSLRQVPLFSCLSEEELASLQARLVRRKFPKNTVVISEGDDSSSLYLIEKGRVWVTRDHESGREVVLATLGAGEFFGEMALIEGSPRSANVVTREPTEVAMVRRPDFQELLAKSPSLALNLMRGLCSRLRNASTNIESLALLDVYGRVARLLIEMSTTVDGMNVIAEPLTHKEIANMVGSSREMVSRIMKDLTTGGYISVNKRRICINRNLPQGW
jgi:CRP/FNR family cyclic AMP-dependent transcriptional regulator